MAVIPSNLAHYVYLDDTPLNDFVTGSRIDVADGDSLKLLGMIPGGYMGVGALSPDGATVYVVTTYYSRGVRGSQTDVLQATDARTLDPLWEVKLPPRLRAQGAAYVGLLTLASEGRFAVVQDATPATSLTVVDLHKRAVTAEIDTAGCWTTFAWPDDSSRISTICGDGTLLTIRLGPDGKAGAERRSEPVFDPDRDPVFTNVVFLENTAYLVSFAGKVIELTEHNGNVSKGRGWSLIGEPNPQHWVPTGYQPTAINEASRQLFVLMHPHRASGSEKDPAQEIWAFDLTARKRVDRAPGSTALGVTVTQRANPRLYVLEMSTMKLVSYSIDGRLRIVGKSALPVAQGAITYLSR